jgi:glycosyltransferase involved in cell wall biosynthesis
MRILHLSNHVRNSGNGIVNVAVDLACAQRGAGFSVAVASSGGQFEGLLRAHNVSHYHLSQQRRPLSLMVTARNFRKLVREFRPDIVHAHMMTGAVLAYLLKWRREYRLVTTVHNDYQRSAILMGLGDRVIAISDAVAGSMAQRGVPSEKIRVVRNGPLGSPRNSDVAGQSALTLCHPAIVTVAGMYVRKGIIPLLNAFAQVLQVHPGAHLYLVGDGPDRAGFEAISRELGISEGVHFEGFQAQPGRYLRGADIFVLASLSEPFGLVIAEAREAGLPVVATRVGGIPEVLDGGEAGTLVPAGDPSLLARALCQLIADPTLLSDGRARARRNIEWLSVGRMHRDTMTVYEELVADR